MKNKQGRVFPESEPLAEQREQDQAPVSLTWGTQLLLCCVEKSQWEHWEEGRAGDSPLRQNEQPELSWRHLSFIPEVTCLTFNTLLELERPMGSDEDEVKV